MMLNTTELLIGILLFLLVFIYAFYEHSMATSTRFQVEALETHIQVLKDQNVILQKRFDTAQKKAAEDMEKVQSSANQILEIRIPADCEDAMKWGIEQAKRMNDSD